MLDAPTAVIFVIGIIAVCVVCARVYRALERAEQDPMGPVVLTRRERTTIRHLERHLGS